MRSIIAFLYILLTNIWVISLSLIEFFISIVVCLPMLGVLIFVMRWPPDKAMQLLIYSYARVWLIALKPFVRLRLINMNAPGIPRPAILVMNHFSVLDVFFVGRLPGYQITVCTRSWPFRMWWYAPFMRLAGYLDTEDQPWSQVLLRCGEVLEDGKRLLIFPEGHRSRDGRLGGFYSGAFKIACENNIPVVPICIKGTDVLLPPDQCYLKPAFVTIKVLKPVYPADFSGQTPHLEMRRHVRRKLQEAMDEIPCSTMGIR